ncbi:hypothetical protein I862_00295 [endosymbiont of Acanthamoeba sp. UWC8]|uniref:hypothetical protein n=1 Tax=endosymbiont of Acanthamoeba sp. UWC8 TaxID=86106 RepID=UPI0004D0C7EF|nr:hypothetical protein [endosymbiont of Acanthamoeba sp. UWC8]AIF80624.1 hypothetical protein I862_00295 [endosymbiont of Acanthamoeba sp. UWC8]
MKEGNSLLGSCNFLDSEKPIRLVHVTTFNFRGLLDGSIEKDGSISYNRKYNLKRDAELANSGLRQVLKNTINFMLVSSDPINAFSEATKLPEEILFNILKLTSTTPEALSDKDVKSIIEVFNELKESSAKAKRLCESEQSYQENSKAIFLANLNIKRTINSLEKSIPPKYTETITSSREAEASLKQGL